MDRRRALMVAIVLALLPAVIVAVISHLLLHLPRIWPGVLVAACLAPMYARQVYGLLVLWGKR